MATPMLEQYFALKKEYPDTILLFRLGDFYEGFADDAKILSKVLGLTLTGRGEGTNRMPMAGIPHHALKNYLPKLIKAQYKVAIADQMEEPVPGQLVKRDVTKVISAGTILDENELELDKNNYLASVYFLKKKKINIWGLSFTDISTGEFIAADYFTKTNSLEIPKELVLELMRINPAELLIPVSRYSQLHTDFPGFNLKKIDDSNYFAADLKADLLQYLGGNSFQAYGLEDLDACLIAAGKLLEYIKENRKQTMPQLQTLTRLKSEDFMFLDEATIRNLELIAPLRGYDIKKTLFGVLNNCRTPMGQRLLRQWVLRPLINDELIKDRLSNVESIFNDQILALEIANVINETPDLERLISKISGKSANGRDLRFLMFGVAKGLKLLQVSNISRIITRINTNLLPQQINYLQSEVVDLIDQAIKEDPAITLTEGDIIKEGFNSELDELRKEATGGKDFLHSLEEREIKRTGISSLKVRYNKVFGYYIEISKSNLSRVPANYIRKQTLTNAERFITEELKTWEERILNSSELLYKMEYQLFEEIRNRISACFDDIITLAKIIAEVDVYLDFAELAITRNYNKPIIHSSGQETNISNSRHPVVESFLQEQFIPNDILFKNNEQELIVLTGPNMSGKSTYIRQIALIHLMAQMGSYVPAAKAQISLVDRVFTRVGASDNLAGGESTFMIEMLETANILNNATKDSLIILDEVGRGTSTYDGMALAWAIIEYIVIDLHAKTLFATHYHDLMLLEDMFPMIKNYNIKVLESEGEVTFMHKIEKGGIDKSFGIHVAKLAGLPVKTIKRAVKIQEELQKKSIKSFIEKHNLIKDSQLDILETNKPQQSNTQENEIIQDILAKDFDAVTPIEALSLLKDLQERIRHEN